MAEAVLKVRELQAGYGEIQVLWGADLDVRRGEIACLIGSNGAGKTTFMRCVSGMLDATAGSIRFDGAELANAGPRRVLAAGIAQVPEGRRLFAAMSVRDNLLMGAYLRTQAKAQLQRDLEKVYAVFPILAERRNQAAGTLSGGQQQMCAIGRGLMSAPKLLMIDELSLGLAPAAVDTLCDALKRLNAEGLTMLVVEQDVTTALELASRAFVMDGGRITRSGTSDELHRDPAVREAYLGSL
jgi:branched-chain amino acid transport system ATP-binding protein